jgi:hypothetical protein
MSEEDLELLITLDDPEGAPEEDTFNHLSAENVLEYLSQGDGRTNEQLIKTTG